MARKSGELYAVGADVRTDLSRNARVAVLHPDFPGWRFFVTFSPAGIPIGFEVIADRVVTDASIASFYSALRSPPGHPADAPAITANFLRSLRLGEIQDAARAALLRTTASWPELKEHWGRAFHEAPRPGRRGRDDRSYAEICALYVEACRSGSSSPVADLSKSLDYSASQLRSILNTGRSRKLLTDAPRGRPGGELTPKALDLLRKDA